MKNCNCLQIVSHEGGAGGHFGACRYRKIINFTGVTLSLDTTITYISKYDTIRQIYDRQENLPECHGETFLCPPLVDHSGSQNVPIHQALGRKFLFDHSHCCFLQGDILVFVSSGYYARRNKNRNLWQSFNFSCLQKGSRI